MIQNLLKQVRGSLSKLPKFSVPVSERVTGKVATSSDSNGDHDSRGESSDLNAKSNNNPKANSNQKADSNLIQETRPASEQTLRRLVVFNSFTKTKQPASANGKPIYLTNDHKTSRLARAYICGPTVYDESHIGHAMTYLRFDLIRRALKRYCSVDLVSIMNITDIDDKIIKRSLDEQKSWQEVAAHYQSSFLKDLHSLNVLPLNAYVPVTSQMDRIIEYIQQLEESGYAYLNETTGDIDLDTARVDRELSNFQTISNVQPGRRSPSDFTLWKAHKPNEPYWELKSRTANRTIKGRPGWHVECSVISSSALGSRLDFHFGGHDLLFPHHVNESRCCKAYSCALEGANEKANDSQIDGSPTDDRLSTLPIHRWSSSWLHFGSLTINEEKMSKSLGNFVQIKKFLRKHPKNTLRLLCIIHPYRRDLTYDEGNLKIVRDLDTKMAIFHQTIANQKNELISRSKLRFDETGDLSTLIEQFVERNLDGIADDFDFNVGWSKLIELVGFVGQHRTVLTLYDLVKAEMVVTDYLDSLGLVYHGSSVSRTRNPNDQTLIRKLVDYRKEVRRLTLDERINRQNSSPNIEAILKLTDNIRGSLASNHLIIEDQKFVKKS